jgi:hypothetical protein
MYTAMAMVALTLGNLTTNPTWLDDYSAAQAKVTVAGKPMAVFVGSGKAGWEAAVREGFDPAVSKLLAEKFVCLYVDASTAKGKKVADAFQVGDRGVVLSDRTGKTQAYSAAGTVSRAELTRALVAYADVEVAQKTDAPKSDAKATTTGTAGTTGTTTGGAVMTAPGAMPGGVMVGPGGTMMAPPGYVGGPVMTGGGNWGGYGYGGYAAGGGCGQSMGGCGGGMGHGCGMMGGGWGGGCGHSSGCGMSHGCGMGHGCGTGGGHGCCGLFGGMMGGWGGGCGGGMGHGCGGCH